MNSNRLVRIAGLAIVAALALSATAVAGPPLLCHQIQIGDAKSLPWGGPGKDAFAKVKTYDAGRVVDDTLGLLDGELPVLARMETLRRATLYIERDARKAERLLGSLLSRTLDAEVVMDSKALALRYFDAGYFAATLQQAGIETSFGPGNAKHDLHRVPGYAWMVRAYKIAEQDADMAVALALVTADTHLTEHTMFLEQAVIAGKPADAARNDLLQWICQIRGTTLEAARAKFSTEHARSEG
jgi:hypothetical protein